MKWDAAWLFGPGLSLALTYAACDADSIVYATTAFVRSKWLKWGATWLFWSWHATSTDVGITWCYQHYQMNYNIPDIKTIKMMSNITFGHVTQLPLPLESVSVSHYAYCIISSTIIFLGQDDRSKLQHDFLIHICHWHWHQHQVMQTALLMAPLHSLGQMIKMKCNKTFGHVTLLPPASHDTDGIINSTITLLISEQSKWGPKCLFQLCMATCASFNVTWCQWDECIPLVKMIEMSCSKNFHAMSCQQHWCWHHMILSAFPMSPFHSLGQENQS